MVYEKQRKGCKGQVGNQLEYHKSVMLHCGAGVASVPAYEMLIQKRPDIPELSYVAGSPHAIMEGYNEWFAKGGE